MDANDSTTLNIPRTSILQAMIFSNPFNAEGADLRVLKTPLTQSRNSSGSCSLAVGFIMIDPMLPEALRLPRIRGTRVERGKERSSRRPLWSILLIRNAALVGRNHVQPPERRLGPVACWEPRISKVLHVKIFYAT